MDRSDKRIDQIFRNNAMQLKVEPGQSSWNRLEGRLPNNIYRPWHPVKIAAVLIPLICLTYIGAHFYQSHLTDQIIDLTRTTEDEFYDNYLGFLKSERYVDLKIAYHSQD